MELRVAFAALMMTLAAATLAAAEEASDPLRCFLAERRGEERELERALDSIPSPGFLRTHHDLLSSVPHPAGSAGDRRVVDNLTRALSAMGLEVEQQELWLYLPAPIDAELAIVEPEVLVLPLQEEPIPGDPFTAHPDLGVGWYAYSGSGEVEGGVVYANYARREDFEALQRLGVAVEGRVVVARLGALLPGFKAKLAEEAGAGGLVLYPDPADNGYMTGITYPEGSWATPYSVPRGALLTLPYPGDPLTPFEPAARDAKRLDPEAVAMPKIPVQPAPWVAVQRIFEQMAGPAVPEGWQGGLPLAYRVEGGEGLTVRLKVEQEATLVRTANVIARLPGARRPAEEVIVGCHHDAWSFGASDPGSGSIVLLEMARSFSALARRGARPGRTLVFAHWGAKEFGIQGSTEWVEANRAHLHQAAVAYLDLDAAAIGRELRISAAPLLRRLIEDAAAETPRPGAPGTNVPEARQARAQSETAIRRPSLGHLGGDGDRLAFYAHGGIPFAQIHACGDSGAADHTNYDTLARYRHVVGEDYAAALMHTRLLNRVVARLANADLLPLDPRGYAPEVMLCLDELSGRAADAGLEVAWESLRRGVDRFRRQADELMPLLWSRLDEGGLTSEVLDAVNWELLQLERIWLSQAGLPGRPWYRSLFAAPDPDTGDASWILPALRYGIEGRDPVALRDAEDLYSQVFRRLEDRLRMLRRLLEPPPDAMRGQASGESIEVDGAPGGE